MVLYVLGAINATVKALGSDNYVQLYGGKLPARILMGAAGIGT